MARNRISSAPPRSLNSHAKTFLGLVILVSVLLAGSVLAFIFGHWVYYDTKKSFTKNILTRKSILSMLLIAGLAIGLYFITVELYQKYETDE